MWDRMTCWPNADVGEVVTVPCPKFLLDFSMEVNTRKKVYHHGFCVSVCG